MITLRPSDDRGQADLGWLQSRHSFSFGDYFDRRHMGWGNLRVINDDRVAPGAGFGRHGHHDMEIISVVLEGALAHRDSMGHEQVLRPGEVQRMSAGRGVQHSEFNAERHAATRFLQIWIEPRELGVAPGYEQAAFDPAQRRGRLQRLVDPDASEGAVAVNADARLYAAALDGDERVTLDLDPARKAYVHVVRGRLLVNGLTLNEGDAALIERESRLSLCSGHDAEVLVFDLTGDAAH